MIEFCARFLWEHAYTLAYVGLLFGLIEWIWPAVEDQPKWRPDSMTDLLYSFLVPLITIPLINAAAHGILSLSNALGLTSTWPGLHEPALWVLHDVQQFVGAQHWYVQILVAVFVGDFVGYWRHRLMHTKYLWPFHAIHHSSQRMDWLSNERFHPVNTIVTGMLTATSLTLCGFTPEVITAHIVVRRYYSMFIHLNIPLSYGVLNYVFISPLMHRWHHSNDPRVIDKNLAVFFSFFDVIFGTYRVPKGEFPTSLGIPESEISYRFLPQMIYPFRKLKAMLFPAKRETAVPLPTGEVSTTGAK